MANQPILIISFMFGVHEKNKAAFRILGIRFIQYVDSEKSNQKALKETCFMIDDGNEFTKDDAKKAGVDENILSDKSNFFCIDAAKVQFKQVVLKVLKAVGLKDAPLNSDVPVVIFVCKKEEDKDLLVEWILELGLLSHIEPRYVYLKQILSMQQFKSWIPDKKLVKPGMKSTKDWSFVNIYNKLLPNQIIKSGGDGVITALNIVEMLNALGEKISTEMSKLIKQHKNLTIVGKEGLMSFKKRYSARADVPKKKEANGEKIEGVETEEDKKAEQLKKENNELKERKNKLLKRKLDEDERELNEREQKRRRIEEQSRQITLPASVSSSSITHCHPSNNSHSVATLSNVSTVPILAVTPPTPVTKATNVQRNVLVQHLAPNGFAHARPFVISPNPRQRLVSRCSPSATVPQTINSRNLFSSNISNSAIGEYHDSIILDENMKVI